MTVGCLGLAESDPAIAGAVVNLQPDRPGFEERFVEACDRRFFVGIRFRPIASYDLAGSTLRKSVERLCRGGTAIEFGAKTAAQKAAFAHLAREFSEGTWIVDHCGHPDSRSLH